MASKDTRIDTYIEKSQPFAKPILKHLRQLVHKGCPQVEETMKWSFPHFEYKGILCSMASFKQHCSFGFWKASVMKDEKKLLNPVGNTAMGHFGRITSLKDLPADKLILGYIKEAVRLNEEEVKLPTRIKAGTIKKELQAPDYLLAALKKNKAAMKTYENFSPSNKKDYIEWITSAKSADTRNTRLETAIEWMAEGKIRNWKYVRR